MPIGSVKFLHCGRVQLSITWNSELQSRLKMKSWAVSYIYYIFSGTQCLTFLITMKKNLTYRQVFIIIIIILDYRQIPLSSRPQKLADFGSYFKVGGLIVFVGEVISEVNSVATRGSWKLNFLSKKKSHQTASTVWRHSSFRWSN